MVLSYKEDTLYPFIICVVYQEPEDFELMDFMIHWVILVDKQESPTVKFPDQFSVAVTNGHTCHDFTILHN